MSWQVGGTQKFNVPVHEKSYINCKHNLAVTQATRLGFQSVQIKDISVSYITLHSNFILSFSLNVNITNVNLFTQEIRVSIFTLDFYGKHIFMIF